MIDPNNTYESDAMPSTETQTLHSSSPFNSADSEVMIHIELSRPCFHLWIIGIITITIVLALLLGFVVAALAGIKPFPWA